MSNRKQVRHNGLVAALIGTILLSCVPLACAQKKTQDSSSSPPPPSEDAKPVETPPPVIHATQAKWLEDIEIGDAWSKEILDALTEERWKDASPLLNAQTLDGAHYKRMTRAYVSLQVDAHAQCIEDVEAVLKDGSLELFTSELNAWGAECAFALKDWAKAATFAAGVSPKSKRHERAFYLLGATLVEGGTRSDIERAQKIFETYLTTYKKGKHAELVRFAYAKLLESQGQASLAARQYNDIITYHSLSSQVPLAIKELGRVKKKASKKTLSAIESTSNTQRINKLRALFKRHRSEDVLKDGKRYTKSFKKGSSLYCESQYLMGKSLTKLRKHSDSIAYYKNVVAHCPSSDGVVKSYYLTGRGQWNAGDRGKASSAFKKLWKAYPSHSYADDAMLYAARIAKSEGDTAKMRKLLKTQIATYPKGDMISDARWLLLQNLYTSNEHKQVVKFARETDAPADEKLYTRGRLDYFAGRSSEALEDKEDARAFYEKVVKAHPLGYYALLAMNRLAILEGSDSSDLCAIKSGKLCDFVKAASHAALLAEPDTTQPIALPEAMTKDLAFQRGGVLLKLGLESLAKREFRDLSGRFAKDKDALWSLAMLLDAAGAYPFSHDIARRKIKGWQVGYPVDESRQYWEIAYPRPFEDSVKQWAKDRDVPSEVIWAIMREESGFNPRIESWANARGLLQLMEGTAATMAKKDDFDDFSKDDMFDVQSNLRLGTAYIKELSDLYDAHPALIIAGYNGGAGNVNRWLTERGDMDLDMWVEEIPYGQTRDYTKRVLTSFWTYGWLYADGKTPALPFTLPEAS